MLKILKRNRFADLKRTGMYRKKLNSIAATRKFIFGALAEIVDNSSDADAKNLYIYSNKCIEASGGFTLNFLDDGSGMDPVEATSLFSFAQSVKQEKPNQIGQFGNGFMTGATRIGNDTIVFTKKNSIGTIVFISQSFLDGEDIASFKIPLPNLRLDQKDESLFTNIEAASDIERETHALELEMIYKYSPYKCLEHLMAQFDLITGKSGTLVTIYNLRLNNEGNTELDIHSDPVDILVSDFEVKFTPDSQLPHKSLREYLSILYLNPRMNMFVQGKRVVTQRLDKALFTPATYHLPLEELNLNCRAHEVIKSASNRTIQLVNYGQKKLGGVVMPKFAQENKTANNPKVERVKETRDQEPKCSSEQNTLTLTFGVNLVNKYADGIFIYSSNRLITMFVQTKQQQTNERLRGIVAIVEVPNAILSPACDKQAFQDNLAAQSLLDMISQRLECYGSSMQLKDDARIQTLPLRKRVLRMIDSVDSERLKKPRLNEEDNKLMSPYISTYTLDLSASTLPVSMASRSGKQTLSSSSSSDLFMDISNVNSISTETKKPKKSSTVKSVTLASKPHTRLSNTQKQISSQVSSDADNVKANYADFSAQTPSMETGKSRSSRLTVRISKNSSKR